MFSRLYDFKYSYLTTIICKQLHDFKWLIIRILSKQLSLQVIILNINNVHTVKLFQVSLSNTNNFQKLIQSLPNYILYIYIYIYICMHTSKYLYRLFSFPEVCIYIFFLSHRWDTNRYSTLWIKVDLELIAMKGYSTLPRPPELESHHRIHFNVIPKTSLFGGVLLLCQKDAVSIF